LMLVLQKVNALLVKKEASLEPHLFWQIDLNSRQVQPYAIAARGECEICNKGEKGTLNMLNEIQSIALTRAAGFRTRTLEQTCKRLLPLVHPYVGIISKLKPYKALDSDLVCNYSSGRNLAFASTNKFWLNNHLRSSSGGKGKTILQAKVSALSEAVERYSMVHQGQKPALIDSYANSREHVIHPCACLNFSANQYANRDKINEQTTSFHQLVPRPFDEQKTQHWSLAYSLTQKQPCYILSEIAYAQFKGKTEDELNAYPDSNGCASGNNYLEAILQGTLELIERDAVAIWWYNMCERPHIRINTIGNAYITRLCDYYKSINRAIHILDITTDLGVPCFVAISYNLRSGKEILYGFGCHLDARIAIERSITELNQLLPLACTERSMSCEQTLYRWMDSEHIDMHPYLAAKATTAIDFNVAYQGGEPGYLETSIETIIKKLSVQGIELIAFDLMQQDTGVPVVKMLAPGLRHFWRRTGPGRLYQVPVKMGWQEQVLTEAELNPHSISI